MARIDWNKVAEDYQKSAFDRARLEQYAKKAAEALKNHNVSFDGFTDTDWHEPPKPVPDMGFGARLRRFFSPEPPPPDTRPLLVRQHLGYWVLETSEVDRHWGYRYTEGDFKMDRYGGIRYKEKRTNVFTGHARIETTKWVLLGDGGLAVYTTKQLHHEYPYMESTRWLRDVGLGALSLSEPHNIEVTDTWELMSDEDILLLDHKKRSIRQRYTQRDEYTLEESECILKDNYLLTGKKGGGCSKKISALLKKHNLLESKPRKGAYHG